MMKSLTVIIGMLIVFSCSVFAIPHMPQGTVDLLNVYGIRNATTINASVFYQNGTPLDNLYSNASALDDTNCSVSGSCPLILYDADLPLANLTSPYCGNITGATSNLCTLTDTDTNFPFNDTTLANNSGTLTVNESWLSSLWAKIVDVKSWIVGNDTFFNNSQTTYTDARDVIVNDSSNDYSDFVNETQTIYTDARDVVVNDSSNAFTVFTNITQTLYTDARDVVYNDSMIDYVVFTNGTMKIYVDARDIVYNESMVLYVDTVNGTQTIYIDARDAVDNLHKHSAANITNDTFGSGHYTFPSDLTVKESLFISNVEVSNQSDNGIWDGVFHVHSKPEPENQLIFIVEGNGTSGVHMPHFWIQNGGAGLTSGITRSFIFANEVVAHQNTTNITSCQAYMDIVNESLKIDCNTDVTGADVIVGDDLQVIDDFWLKTSRDEWRFFSLLLSLYDDQLSNLIYNQVSQSFVGTTFSINDTRNESFVININSTVNFTDRKGDSVVVVEGTNSSPAINYIDYLTVGNPTLTRSATYPGDSDIEHVDIARIIEGNKTTYLWDDAIADLRRFVYESYERAQDEGALYKIGLDITGSSTHLNISDGTVRIRMKKVEYDNNVTSDDFFLIENNGLYTQCDDFTCFVNYSSGELIASNKYFTVVWGVIPVDGTSKLMALVNNKPTTEYISVAGAESDTANSAIFFPNEVRIKPTFVPVARTVHRLAGTQVAETLSNTLTYLDIRGSVTTSAGAPASPPITEHNEMNNLAWSVAEHVVDTALDWSGYGIFADWINSSDWSNISIFESQISDLVHTVNGTDLNVSSVIISSLANCDTINTTETGELICGNDAGASAGDITAVFTPGKYLTNGSNTGDVNLFFNETVLNATIDDRASGVGDGNSNCSVSGSCPLVGYVADINSWISGNDTFFNDSQTTYTDARDVIVNDSAVQYSVFVNTTQTVYTDARDVVYNGSMIDYVFSVNQSQTAYTNTVDTNTNCSVAGTCSDVTYTGGFNNSGVLNHTGTFYMADDKRIWFGNDLDIYMLWNETGGFLEIG